VGLTGTYSLSATQAVRGSHVQLSSDPFNFDMHGNLSRDLMTWVQQQILGGGMLGTNFRTIFGPTRTP
jgi:hypothetical protein